MGQRRSETPLIDFFALAGSPFREVLGPIVEMEDGQESSVLGSWTGITYRILDPKDPATVVLELSADGIQAGEGIEVDGDALVFEIPAASPVLESAGTYPAELRYVDPEFGGRRLFIGLFVVQS